MEDGNITFLMRNDAFLCDWCAVKRFHCALRGEFRANICIAATQGSAQGGKHPLRVHADIARQALRLRKLTLPCAGGQGCSSAAAWGG